MLEVSSGWAGFGIPAEAGEMIGGSAIIVKACPTCPTGKYSTMQGLVSLQALLSKLISLDSHSASVVVMHLSAHA